ncbi:2,5-diketo-D-gluconate reductase A [Geodermatophilus pulveris]|uniref:2,5-diketo-D-gluconate reductase A n=1 Tax=Geodermatophilus pulveris TaxID=1564159 RepID=A0A239JED3_9ACTN|nr:aldo/keto reductase [Geodermatophilus pulveris]SNT04271.1 2,5-diketo-D-gluconate reductase A [Geodermatophilus pulveris]
MTTVPSVSLHDGVTIPQLGLGTARLPDEETRRIVREALAVGYRFVDTAASYGNERGVGQGIADSGLPREEVFVSTKLRGRDQGYETAKAALRASLDRLGTDHVDLYLIHWPLPRLDRYVESWRAMEELLDEGLTRTIGVSNFLPEHLDRLAAASSTVPAVNQIECHPREPQLEQRADDARRGIVTESWSPLANGGELLQQPVLTGIAARHRRTPAQVVLRWHVQQGLVTFPKASSRGRLVENLDVFDFELDDEDMAGIATLADGTRVNGQYPDVWEEF